MTRIAIINQKGGVGKTTTAANLGVAFGRAGLRTLLVDLDAQANLSLHLAGDESQGGGPSDALSSFEVLVDGEPLERAICELTAEGVDLVPASGDLSGIEQALSQHIGRELILRDALTVVDSRYDVVLLDCPPSLGVLSLNALAAADRVLIPLQTEFFALQGMTQLLEVVDVVRSRLNPRIEVAGILPCLVDQRTRLAAEVVEEIQGHFSDLLLESRIRKNVKLAEAPSFGQSIFRYAPESNGAADYAGLAGELATRLGLAIARPAAEPAARGPAASEPAASGPAAGKPAAGKPAAGEPAAGEPAAGEPAASGPAAGEPAASEAPTTESAATERARGEARASDGGLARPTPAEREASS